MIKKLLYAAPACFLLWLSSPAVRAETLDFTLTGEGSTYAFQLPSSPTPNAGSNDAGFAIANVIITLDGTSELAAEIAFLSEPAGGGLEFVGDLPLFDGPQLFSGDPSAPTFITGDYSLVNSQDQAPYTLTITDAPAGGAAPVPELRTWLMLLAGFAAMAGMRKRAARLICGGLRSAISAERVRR
jgi:hypothetical protein